MPKQFTRQNACLHLRGIKPYARGLVTNPSSALMIAAGLDVFTGPMFAGKSGEAVRRIRRWLSIRGRVLAVKHSLDDRYNASEIATHDAPTGLIECNARSTLLDLRDTEEYRSAEVVVIDEAQFFFDLYDFCKKAVDDDNKRVQVFGLDGTAKREPFGQVALLCPIADTFQKMTALCGMCENETPAPFTVAIKPFPDEGEVLIGGADIYMAVCRYHHLEHSKHEME